jgi:CheY-like chemotaxis protein
VYGIVRQHHGHITVESQVGSGTMFSIYLPMTEGAVAEKPVDTTYLLDLTSGQEKAILLVDDNPTIRELIEEILTLSGYRVLTAVHGRDALAVLTRERHQIGLILSDLDMPEMGGLELARTLRLQGDVISMVILSGYIPDETLRHLKAMGVSECITKPVEADKLLGTVEYYLNIAAETLEKIPA